MLTHHLALVSQTPAAPVENVIEVAAAIQRQITRDFAPIWGVSASVDTFARLDAVPTGYWPIILRDDLPDPGAVGLHLDDHGQPLAILQASNSWSLTASHEALEMLADPYGNRLVPGGSLRPGQGVAEFLVEVADPVASIDHAYTVHGIVVSDFVTPQYYEHPLPVPGTSYSFTGAVRRPRDVVNGGYVSWRETLSQEWWIGQRSGGQLTFEWLGVIQGDVLGLRTAVDGRFTPDELFRGVSETNPYLAVAREQRVAEAAAASIRAQAWQRGIAGLVGPARTPGPRPVSGGGSGSGGGDGGDGTPAGRQTERPSRGGCGGAGAVRREG
jgi:hypothetical protein